MQVSGGEKSKWISFDISPLFYHTVSKLVHALGITHDEIFQALAAEGDVLPPKPFLDLGFDAVVRWKSPASKMIFFSLCQRRESPREPGRGCTVGGVGSRNGFGSRTSPTAARAWKISSYDLTRVRTSLETVWKVQDWCPNIYICFLISSYLQASKNKLMKTGNLTFRLPLVVFLLFQLSLKWPQCIPY
jgi:hypothetical protein